MSTPHEVSQIQIKDMTQVETHRWAHRGLKQTQVHEFVDPVENRVVRVYRLRKLFPKELASTSVPGVQDDGHYVPRHHHNFDQMQLTIKLPLPDSGSDPLEILDGSLVYRPEGVWYGPFRSRGVEGVDDGVIINASLQFQGANNEQFITKEQITEAVATLDREMPGSFRHERGDFVDADGTVIDGYEIAWKTAVGRDVTYADQPRIANLIRVPVTAYPFLPSTRDDGVQVKPLIAFNANGPFVKLWRVESGAELSRRRVERYRLLLLLAGELEFEGGTLTEMTAVFVTPGTDVGAMKATQGSLIATVDWQPLDQVLAPFWED